MASSAVTTSSFASVYHTNRASFPRSASTALLPAPPAAIQTGGTPNTANSGPSPSADILVGITTMQPPQMAAASQQQQQQQSQQQSQQQQQHSQHSAGSQSFSSSQNVNMQSSYRQYTDPAPKPQVDDVMPIYSVSSPTPPLSRDSP